MNSLYFLIFFLLLAVNALVMVKIHRYSLYQPMSACAFIRNASLAGDLSIQSCSWQCIYEHNCQTATFFQKDKNCSLFTEFYTIGTLQPSGSVSASVISCRKNHGKHAVSIERSLEYFARSYHSMFEHCGINC